MSQDLINRLRAKPCDTISPPAIELEAADRLEELERTVAELRKRKPIPVNMNAEVTVTLTAFGARIWTEDDAAWKNAIPQAKLELNPKAEGDTVTTTLWTLMRLYGSFFYPGMVEIPFKDNSFTIEHTRA